MARSQLLSDILEKELPIVTTSVTVGIYLCIAMRESSTGVYGTGKNEKEQICESGDELAGIIVLEEHLIRK